MDKAARNEYLPDHAVAPGDVLAHELELRGMPRAELAKRTGLSEKHVNSILKGRGNTIITPETAIKLERAVGMPVEYWLNLEAIYQETRARLAEQARLETHLDWLCRIPVNEMVKRGWLKEHKDKRAQLDEVLRFFGIASVDQWSAVWPRIRVAFRQHRRQTIIPEAVSAWLRQGELEAAQIECDEFNRKAFLAALSEARALTIEPDPQRFIPELKRRFARAGVAVVFVPALPKTGLSGATRWLSPRRAMVQLSLRYKTNDHLWFTLFHEAGHILLHGKKELFLEGANGMDSDREQEADQFAADHLINRRDYRNFVRSDDYSHATIKAFANQIGIAPGIVVGRLQYEGILPHNRGNDLKVRYQWS